MTTILVSVDTDVTRAREQVESIIELPLENDKTEAVLYHVFRADDEGADARDLKSVFAATDRLEEAGFDVDVSQSNGDAVRETCGKPTRSTRT